MAELLNDSLQINFPKYQIDKNYGFLKTDELYSHIKSNNAIVFLALQDSVLFGFIWCHKINRLNTTRLHISEIVVDKQYRSMGIGQLLMLEAEQFARLNNIEELDLLVTKSNDAAVAFYESLSFSIERYLMKKTL